MLDPIQKSMSLAMLQNTFSVKNLNIKLYIFNKNNLTELKHGGLSSRGGGKGDMPPTLDAALLCS